MNPKDEKDLTDQEKVSDQREEGKKVLLVPLGCPGYEVRSFVSTVLKNVGGGYSVSLWTVVRAQWCELVEGLKEGLEIWTASVSLKRTSFHSPCKMPSV